MTLTTTRPTRTRTRAASAKPASKGAPTTTTTATTSKALLTIEEDVDAPRRGKRARSPSAGPAPKRTRGAMAPPSTIKLPKTTRGQTLPIPHIPALAQLKPYFNPLPLPPPTCRPALQLFVWGAGNCGQFGLGVDLLDELSKPRKHSWVERGITDGLFGEEGAGLEAVAAGGMHTLFIDEKGVVWSCGLNDDAALGRVTERVVDPENLDTFLDSDELTSTPHPLRALIDADFRAVQVVAGDSICAALSDAGELRVWGSFRSDEGSLGFADGLKHQFLPVPILHLSHRPGDTEKVSSLAAGANHIVVLTTHGNILTWGASEQGQLGRKVLERRKIQGTVPEKITLGLRSRRAVTVGAGVYHSFAVDEGGDLWAWGLNSMGQTGTGYKDDSDTLVLLPTKVPNLSKEALKGDRVVQIAGGEHHTLFLSKEGKVWACGRSNAGQLGLADDHPSFQDRAFPDFLPEPTLVTFPDPEDPVRHISVGTHNNMACTEGGALYSWGQGTQSELGTSEVEVRTPQVIVRKEGGSWKAVATSCGGQHTLGLFRKRV